ncbi:hypothetical protein CTAM01_06945 [Colletotrichum tamarilloi]|uniref:Nephrocystin 3-like N-terminal domain-containing protein n=1 Tax=Colletotrichum tamarilloi TaxID=1209934 RepID=A0ABQ9RAK5_9PEZI|nr:uncharacterized protein CTAM01_06945 [Colletotrichum tamarilloi]KAK1499751.1 hypothetical protein CTAM01_06945 [Colletotrichum tamarilloi]
MSFGFGVGDFIAVIDKLRHCHDRFSEAPELFVSLVRNVEIIEPLLEEAHCPQQNLNDGEKKILEDIIEGSYKDLKRLKQILDDCQELKQPLEKKIWDKARLLQFLQRLQVDPRVINNIQSSLSVKIALLNTLKNASDSRAIQSTKQAVDSMHHEQVSKHRQEILEWLTPSNYSSQQRDYFSTRHPETASWLLESKEFEWVANRGQTLLCHGMPGAGKTIMTSVVIDHLIHRFREEPRVGIAYVYCNFKDTERQDCHDLLSSLAKQLAQSCSEFPQSLETLYDKHQKRKTSRSTQETIDLLQVLSSCYERTFIVVDALDECDRNARQAFLPEILRLQQRSQVNIFATTREIPEILESKEFENSISVEIRANQEDVLRYTSDRMARMQSFVRNNLDLQKEIRHTIAEKVNGMFLLARLLIDAWSNKLSPKELKKALKVFGETSEKANIYSAVYNEAMNRIRSQPSEHVELALNVLSWTTGAKRPLTIEELQHALAVEEGETNIDQDNIIPVETMISTTQEYFERKRHQFFPDIDSQIAIACTNYLSIKNVYKLPRDYDFYEYDSAPFFNYAALYWAEHTRESSIIPTEVVGFLRNQDARNRSVSVLRRLRWMRSIPRTSAQVAAYFGILQLFTNYTLPEIDMYSVDESGEEILTSVASMTGTGSALPALMSGAVIAERHDLNMQEPSIQNPASVDVEENVTAALQLLVEMGADIGAQDHHGKTPVYWAIVSRNIPALHFLLEKNVEAEVESNGGKRPLLQAVAKSSMAVVEVILDHNVDIDATDEKGRIALSWAAGCGNLAAVQLLLKNGTKVDVPDKGGRTPLAWACAAKDTNYQIIRTLLAYGASPDIGGSAGAIWLYARHKFDLAIIDMFCQYGFDMCSEDDLGATLLCYAARHESAEAFKMILELTNLDLNSKDHSGRTVLWYAMKGAPWRRSKTEVVRMILDDTKADHDCLGIQQALIQAIDRNFVGLFRCLLTREGVSINGEFNGKDAMLYAAEKGSLSIFMSLKEYGAVWGQNQCENVEILSSNLWRFKEIDIEKRIFKWSYHKGQLL